MLINHLPRRKKSQCKFFLSKINILLIYILLLHNLIKCEKIIRSPPIITAWGVELYMYCCGWSVVSYILFETHFFIIPPNSLLVCGHLVFIYSFLLPHRRLAYIYSMIISFFVQFNSAEKVTLLMLCGLSPLLCYYVYSSNLWMTWAMDKTILRINWSAFITD